MLCILYVSAVGALLCVAGQLVERLLPATSSRRWVWCTAIPLSIALPGFYRTFHNWTIAERVGQQSTAPSLTSWPTAIGLNPFDATWWARAESYDSRVSQLWLIVSGILLIWGVVNSIRLSELLDQSLRNYADRDKPHAVDGIPIVVTDQIGPATTGLLRSRVVIPRWVLALPAPERRYVLRHEEEHRRAHDAHLLFLASLTILLMPWNLALWWQLRRLHLAIELDCDNRVVAALGDANAYGESLLKIAQTATRRPRIQPAFLGGVGMLERRLNALLAPAPLMRLQRLLLSVVAMALFFLVFWMPHPILGPCAAAKSTSSAHTAARSN